MRTIEDRYTDVWLNEDMPALRSWVVLAILRKVLAAPTVYPYELPMFLWVGER